MDKILRISYIHIKYLLNNYISKGNRNKNAKFYKKSIFKLKPILIKKEPIPFIIILKMKFYKNPTVYSW